MARTYNTIQQHDPIRVPSNWTGQERTFVAQLEQILDDIYRRFGRLTLADLSEETAESLKDGSLLEDGAVKASQLEANVGEKLELASATDLGGVTAKLNEYIAKSSKYLDFGASLQIRGNSDSNFKLLIDADNLGFYENDTLISYLSNNTLHTKKAEIESEMGIGKYVVRPNANGGMGFFWRG